MITEEELKQICEKYDIDYKKLITKNSNVLTYAHKDDIYNVLNFLKTEVNIESKNIEKCPSILYLGIDNVKMNYRFLKEKNIRNYDVETCLHILSTKGI